MPHVTDEGTGLPPGRYGSPRTTPKWVIALLAVLGLAALLPIVISAAGKAAPEIRGTLTSFDVISDNQVKASVDITKPESKAVACTVQARNFYSDVVGSASLEIAAGSPGAVVSRTFPTSDKAVVVEVTNCAERSGG